MFIELTDSQTSTRTAINVNAITEFYEGANQTHIWTIDNRQIAVKEDYDIIKRTIIKMENE